MVSIKDERFGGGRTGSGMGVNPTSPEIYLYDQIDDIRDWIKKNKRSNLTGKQIKPIISKWISNLDKVYSSFNDDKTIPNAALIRGLLIQTKDYLSKIVNKQDSELTYEYLVKMGSPDRSRQAFWFGVDNLFAKLNEGLGIVKQGSLYKYKNSKNQGVLNGNIDKAEVEEPKRRWFGPARILGGAGSGKPLSASQQHTRMPDALPTPTTAGPTAKPLFGSALPPADDKQQAQPIGRPQPNVIPTQNQANQQAQVVNANANVDIDSDALDANDFSYVVRGNKKAIAVFNDIRQRATNYLKDAADFASSAMNNIYASGPIINDMLKSIDMVKKYKGHLNNEVEAMTNSEIEQLAKLTFEWLNKGNKKDKTSESKIISHIGYLPENIPLIVFGVNLNSTESLGKMSIQGNNNQPLGKNDPKFQSILEMAQGIRNIIYSRRDMYESVASSNGKIQSIVDDAYNDFVADFEDFTNDDNKYVEAMIAFLNQSNASSLTSNLDAIESSLNKIKGLGKDASEMYGSDEFSNEVDAIYEKVTKIRESIFDPQIIEDKLKVITQYTNGSPIKWISLAQSILDTSGGKKIDPGTLLVEMQKIVKNGVPGNVKDIITAYEEDTHNMAADVKSIQLVRSLAKQEMVKMFNEIESYWG